MEFVRQYIDADSLASVITLPQSLQNRQLEIIILPAEHAEPQETAFAADRSSVVQTLIGSVPDSGLSLEEYRRERLTRYEAAD